MKRSAAIAMISVCGFCSNIASSQASLAALPCKVEFFFNKRSSDMLNTAHVDTKDYDLQKQAAKQFTQYDRRLRSESLFYVIGTVSGEEDMSTDHRIATARALAVRAWLQKRGIPLERIFLYAVVPDPQTPYGSGHAEALFCNKECPCRNGFDQRAKVLDPDEFAPEYPIAPK